LARLGPDLAEADLALARSQSPARRFVEGREQGGAAVVANFQRRRGAAGETHGKRGDVLLQVGDGFPVADQHGLAEPDVGAGFDADAGATNSEAGNRQPAVGKGIAVRAQTLGVQRAGAVIPPSEA
jgi:hypothetical protein